MPHYSAIFIRTTAMSLRPTSLQLCRLPKILVKPSPMSRVQTRYFFGHLHLLRPTLGLTCLQRGSITCFRRAADSRTLELDSRKIDIPYLQQQRSLNYGRFAYEDVSSDESDLELGSPQQQQQQMVSLCK